MVVRHVSLSAGLRGDSSISIRSYRASQVDGYGFEIFNTRYYGKNLQVALVWSLGGIEESFPPDTAVSHMLYIDEKTVGVGDVAQALEFAEPGDCLMLLCTSQAVSSAVCSFLRPVA